MVISEKVNQVSDPVFLSLAEINEKYYNNHVLVTNMEKQGRAGVVRYFTKYAGVLHEVAAQIEADEETYGRLLVYFVGGTGNFLSIGRYEYENG